jgi:hypothetical protein
LRHQQPGCSQFDSSDATEFYKIPSVHESLQRVLGRSCLLTFSAVSEILSWQ